MIYYLAYGSNMAQARLKRRIPSAQKLGVVPLTGHRLTFDNESSKDGSGKCAALMTDDPADLLLAVLYRMAAAEKPLLDRYEGLGVEYRDAFIPVLTPAGQQAEALIYYATNLNSLLRPYHWYKEHVLRGALENGFPAAYVEQIRAVESIADHDLGREQQELSIYSPQV